MKRYLLIFVFYYLIIEISFAQSNIYLKLIEDNKYSKAEKKLSKKYDKNSDDIELNHAYALLYNSKENSNYNPFKSYDFINKSLKTYEELNEEEKLKYIKKGYSKDSLFKVKEKCFELALNDCKSINSIDCFKNYILFFSDAVIWKDIAQRAIYEISFLNAKKINTTESYLNFINNFNSLRYIKDYNKSVDLFNLAWRNIYELDFTKAKALNTINSFQEYINKYSNSHLINEAKTLRNKLAYIKACNINNINAYQEFIDFYPDAVEINDVIRRRDELAFNDAITINTAESLRNFILKYPNSSFIENALITYDSCLFHDVTKSGNVTDYWEILKQNPQSKYYNNIKDSLFYKIKKQNLLTEIDKYIKEFGIAQLDSNELKDYINILFNDGDINTYILMYNKYLNKLPENILNQIETDFEKLKKISNLTIDIGVRRFNEKDYEQFIIKNAPKEIAYICVQKMAERFILKNDWQGATNIFVKFKPYFPNMTERFSNVIELFTQKEKAIIIESISQINSKYDDYSPVISYDSKQIYFCSKNREDGLGGEDIYLSEWLNDKWTKPALLSDLNTIEGNEAPLAISADGNILLFWRNENQGDIYYSIRSKNGWGNPIAFPYPINTEYYEGDASFTADGKGILFTSSRPIGFNVFTENKGLYHGDNDYPTDIYVSLKSNENEWSTPLNLGSQINTPYTERTPFLHPDGKTLYFSSDGHYGLGKTDVFMSQRINDTTWTKWTPPINMGRYINTPDKDWGFKFSTDGENVFYSVDKKKYELSSLILVLDISGSMDGEKLDALKTASLDACKTALKNYSEVAIMAFAGESENPIIDKIDFTEDYVALANFIENLYAGGGTPMYEAVLEANKYMVSKKSKASKNQMILLMSDGDANGYMEFNSFLNSLSSKGLNKIPHQCIALDVSEYSKAYSDLVQISQLSGGKFYHAKSYNDLNNVFAEATSSLYDLTLTNGTGKDIFSFKIPNHLKPDFVATISGKLVDKNNNPIQATISWEDLETNKVIGESKSNPIDGSFYIILPLGKIYGYYIDNKELFPVSNNIDLRNNTTPISVEQNIDVVTFKEMIEQGTAVPINNLFFNFGTSGLLPESLPELQRVASIIFKNGLKVEISGHTDDIGTESQNQVLSEIRANNVKDYLISQGCDTSIFTIIGFGATRNIAENTTEDGRKKNRRVELRFLKN